MKKFFFVLLLLLAAFPAHKALSAAKNETVQGNTMKNPFTDKSTVYFAGGCFWGIEKLYESIDGVLDAESGYANGNQEIVPDYQKVVRGDTGYKETVKVTYDPAKVSLEQLLTAFFYVIDPTVKNRQAYDIGTQYQTGIYFTDKHSEDIIRRFTEKEKTKYAEFAVETEPLKNFYTAEEYHQNYLNKNPQGYCHILPDTFKNINEIIRTQNNTQKKATFSKPSQAELKAALSPLQYEVTQNAATERAFSGEYWDFYEKGIYVDITTGEPLFSSLDKFKSSCGWPSFQAPINKNAIQYNKDTSYGMIRTEVKSKNSDAHLGHVFEGEPESPNGIRYCINSAALKFIPYEKMKEEGYADWLWIFEK